MSKRFGDEIQQKLNDCRPATDLTQKQAKKDGLLDSKTSQSALYYNERLMGEVEMLKWVFERLLDRL